MFTSTTSASIAQMPRSIFRRRGRQFARAGAVALLMTLYEPLSSSAVLRLNAKLVRGAVAAVTFVPATVSVSEL